MIDRKLSAIQYTFLTSRSLSEPEILMKICQFETDFGVFGGE